MNRMKKLRKSYPDVFALILCIAVVLGAAAIYFGIGALLPRSMSTFDSSADGKYTLHDETKKLLSEIDCDINILLVSESGIPEYGIPEMLLRSYEEENDRIKLSVVSSLEVPERYGNLTDGCAIIRSGMRETVIYSSDYFDVSKEYFEYNYAYYDEYVQAGYNVGTYYDFMSLGYGIFDISKYQYTLTGAIRYVAAENIVTLYSVTEHGESVPDSYLYPHLRDNMMELSFGTLADGIPENADGVLINDPVYDITEADAAILSEFTKNGGKVTVITSYDNMQELKNLRAFCEEYGLSSDEKLVCEDESGRYFYTYPDALIPLVNTDAFGGYLDGEYSPVVPGATGITLSERAGITSVSLINTSVNSYTKVVETGDSLAFNEEKDERRQYSLAALATVNESGGSVLWMSSATLGDSVCDTASSLNNFPVYVAALGVQYGSEYPVDIPSVSMITEPMDAPESAFAVGMIIAIAVPCLIVGIGALIIVKRRSR